MDSQNLASLVDQLLEKAQGASAGRAAQTIHGGHEHDLRQTVIALLKDQGLASHESPGEATLQVLKGHIRLNAGDESWDGTEGDFVLIPPTRHSVDALDDSAILLTVATKASAS